VLEEEEEEEKFWYCVDGFTAVSEKPDGKWQTSAKLQNFNFLIFHPMLMHFAFPNIHLYELNLNQYYIGPKFRKFADWDDIQIYIFHQYVIYKCLIFSSLRIEQSITMLFNPT